MFRTFIRVSSAGSELVSDKREDTARVRTFFQQKSFLRLRRLQYALLIDNPRYCKRMLLWSLL